MGVSMFTLGGAWLGLLAVGLATFGFALRQNRPGQMGGQISWPKRLWLSFAVYAWFVLCPLLAIDPGLARPLRQILIVFSLSMGLRGVAELFLLFVTKTWRPLYGISHDVFSMVIVAGGLTWFRDDWDRLHSSTDWWTLAWLVMLLVSLALETWYAAAFSRAVEGKTTGDDGLWFAAAGDPRFTWINRVTTVGNLVLYLFLGSYLVALTRAKIA